MISLCLISGDEWTSLPPFFFLKRKCQSRKKPARVFLRCVTIFSTSLNISISTLQALSNSILHSHIPIYCLGKLWCVCWACRFKYHYSENPTRTFQLQSNSHFFPDLGQHIPTSFHSVPSNLRLKTQPQPCSQTWLTYLPRPPGTNHHLFPHHITKN